MGNNDRGVVIPPQKKAEVHRPPNKVYEIVEMRSFVANVTDSQGVLRPELIHVIGADIYVDKNGADFLSRGVLKPRDFVGKAFVDRVLPSLAGSKPAPAPGAVDMMNALIPPAPSIAASSPPSIVPPGQIAGTLP